MLADKYSYFPDLCNQINGMRITRKPIQITDWWSLVISYTSILIPTDFHIVDCIHLWVLRISSVVSSYAPLMLNLLPSGCFSPRLRSFIVSRSLAGWRWRQKHSRQQVLEQNESIVDGRCLGRTIWLKLAQLLMNV